MFLKQAKTIAVETCYRLQQYCIDKKINIAGSVRRKKAEPNDIEIVCLPKVTEITDLFGNVIAYERPVEFIGILNGLGKIIKGNAADGKMMQIALKENIMLDLFMPDECDYYRIFCIRTGPRDYSHHIIANAWVNRGWVGCDKGLRKIIDCEGIKQVDGTRKWKCINPDAELPPVWQSEEGFFAWLRIPYKEPELRNL